MTPENIEDFIRGDWFSDHIADYAHWPLQNMEKVIWKNPRSSTYYVNYILAGSYLYVSGDVGDAIYCSGVGSLKRWSESDIGYFASKCAASENGRLYKEWDREKIQEIVREALKEYSDKTWDDLEAAGGESCMGYEQEWNMWLFEHASEFFGADPCYWPSNGKVVSPRCRGHLIGLQMAVKQLIEKGEIE